MCELLNLFWTELILADIKFISKVTCVVNALCAQVKKKDEKFKMNQAFIQKTEHNKSRLEQVDMTRDSLI